MTKDLRSWAKMALDENGDDPHAAVHWLKSLALTEPALADLLAEIGAWAIVRQHFSAERDAALTMAVGRVAANLDSPAMQKRLAGRIARRAFWEQYRICGLVQIRDATQKQLRASAEDRLKQARGQLRRSRFEEAVANRLSGPEAVVRDELTDDEVQMLAVSIMKDAAFE